MRTQRAIVALLAISFATWLLAQVPPDDPALIGKIELLGAVVERDETLPNEPVVKISLRRDTRFTAKHLHLFKGLPHLRSVDLGKLPFTADDIKELWQPELIANLLMDSNADQYLAVLLLLKERQLAASASEAELDLPPFSREIPLLAEEREIRAKRQANAALTLIHLNQPEKVWPLLRFEPDPRRRSELIHRFAPYGVAPERLIERLQHETDLSIQRALVLSLGEYDDDQLPKKIRETLLPWLHETYASSPDAGLHAAVHWLLGRWNYEDLLNRTNAAISKSAASGERWKQIEAWLSENRQPKSPRWYVNSQTQTLIVIPGPVEFKMGSPPEEEWRDEGEVPHQRRINRTFAIGSTHVTYEQYCRFDRKHLNGVQHAMDLPAVRVSWMMAARYCNWLSEREKLQACFDITGDGVALKRDYLTLSGYRFPTEAEVEYATRAGSVTSRYFGESADLLPKYGFYHDDSPETLNRVAQRKPNEFGLFDSHGNVWTWCLDKFDKYPANQAITGDDEGDLSVPENANRVLRGGSNDNAAISLRSAKRAAEAPTREDDFISFRIARTIPTAPPKGAL